jgi:hypothetical protein
LSRRRSFSQLGKDNVGGKKHGLVGHEAAQLTLYNDHFSGILEALELQKPEIRNGAPRAVSGAGYAGKRGDEYRQQQAPGAYQNPGFDRRLP